MKQFNEFVEWADAITEIDAKNVKKAQNRAPIAGEKDIARQAQTKYSGYDREQSLELFINDKLEDMEKRDLDQNKVINAQRKENDKLRRELTTLGQEVQDIEQHSASDHREIERIRALSGQLKGDVETRQVDRKEVEQALQQLERIKSKPGADPQKMAELEKSIQSAKKNSEEFAALKDLMKNLESMKSIDVDEYKALVNRFEEYKTAQEKSWSTRQKWGMTRLKNFDKKIKELETETKVATGIAQDVGDELDVTNNNLEQEIEINRYQDKFIKYLDQKKQDRAGQAERQIQRQQNDTRSRQNPYAYADADEVQQPSRKPGQTDLGENTMFDDSINSMCENILGPEYSKYLK